MSWWVSNLGAHKQGISQGSSERSESLREELIRCVCMAVVCNPPRVAHSHVACSYNDANLTSTTCKYVCNRGYVAPKSLVPYFTWNCSDADLTQSKTTTPKCISIYCLCSSFPIKETNLNEFGLRWNLQQDFLSTDFALWLHTPTRIHIDIFMYTYKLWLGIFTLKKGLYGESFSNRNRVLIWIFSRTARESWNKSVKHFTRIPGESPTVGRKRSAGEFQMRRSLKWWSIGLIDE